MMTLRTAKNVQQNGYKKSQSTTPIFFNGLSLHCTEEWNKRKRDYRSHTQND